MRAGRPSSNRVLPEHPVARPTGGGRRGDPSSTGGERRLLGVEGPLDLRRTLQAVTFAWGRFEPDGWWRPLRTPEGPATLHVRRDGRGVEGRAWGPGAGWVLARLPGWVGLEDQPEAFATDHPLVGRLHRSRPGLRFARTGLVFEALLVAIASQKVTGREAGRALAGMCARFSGPAPGPHAGLRLPPDPARLAEAPYHAFHQMGMERRRAETVRRAAAEAGRLDVLAGAAPERARDWIERLRGAGPWSSAETVAVSHGDADAVSVGDFHHKHVVAWHLAGEARGTDERMLELLEPFRPHRGRVVRLLGHGYPRFGPRQPVRDFAGF